MPSFPAQNSKCLLNCTPGIPTGLLEGNHSVVEGGDGGEHEEREAAREGHVQAETGPGAPRRPAEPRSEETHKKTWNETYCAGLKSGPGVARIFTGKLRRKWYTTVGTAFTKPRDHFLAL